MAGSLSNADEVCDYVDDNLVIYNFMSHPQKFCPTKVFDQITRPHEIHDLVAKQFGLILNTQEQADLIARISKSGRKLFAICVYNAIPLKFLKAMLDNGLTDKSLPLEKPQLGSLMEKRRLVRGFFESQKYFNTRSFAENAHYRLDERLSDGFSIPIDKEEMKGEGAFGKVWQVRIHPDYHNFSCGNIERFAMKITDAKHAPREQNYHLAMAGLTHSHLVKCLASFTLGSEYFMIYELADCDLELFIKEHSVASKWPSLTSSWLAHQLSGLAAALQVVHNPKNSPQPSTASTLTVPSADPDKTGYIHDIKPENILVSKYSNGHNWLRLSDFSCARVVGWDSTVSGNRRSYRTHTESGTPRYRAPESAKKGGTSRPYDMWSLGCVYLEVLVWFIEGYTALNRFRDLRESECSSHSLIDEGFFHDTPSGLQLRQSVISKMADLSRNCTGDLQVIANIIPSLLKIQPEKRLTASQLATKLKLINSKYSSTIKVPHNIGNLSISATATSSLPYYEEDSDQSHQAEPIVDGINSNLRNLCLSTKTSEAVRTPRFPKVVITRVGHL